MNLTAILLTVACLGAAAGGHSQLVTLKVKNAPLKTVFVELNRQTGYNFLYSDEALSKAGPVSLDVKNESLKTVLGICFKNQPLLYIIENDAIVVKAVSQPSTGRSGPDTEPLPPAGIEIKVVDSLGYPLSGATVTIKNSKVSGVTDAEGVFNLSVAEGDVLLVSYVGYETRQVIVTPSMLSSTNNLIITLRPSITKLEEIQVSSGYQYIPKERATGSFDFVDNKTYNRAVSTDLISRLNGIANGMIFSDKTGNAMHISIRGRSTLFSNTQPLIVLDNFPFEGKIENINPNDVESITLLKDAAAASIWGTRAGNGVLVITTKKGKLNRPAQVSLNSNITVTGKPDLHYQPRMSTADYIDAERFIFSKGYYNTSINRKYTEISPVVAILAQQRSGLITEAEADAQIAAFSQYDILADMEKYLYQNAVNQQYQVSVSGGNASNAYYLSAGFDKNLSTTKGSGYDRYTVKANNTFYGLKQRLQFSTDLNFTTSKTYSLGGGYNNPKYPYLRLADDEGNPAEVNTLGGLNPRYTDTVGGGLLLDWKYRPLEELNNRSQQTEGMLNSMIINLNLSYKILKSLSFGLYYQYNKSMLSVSSLYDETSFYTRNQINSFSQINRQTGIVFRPIPLGGILNSSVTDNLGNLGRAQLNFQQNWGKNKVTAIGGYEIRSTEASYQGSGYQYGYNKENETFQTVIDQVTSFPNFYSGAASRINTGASRSSSINRNISYYSNIGYVFDERFLASASFRKDESNLFGVDANQRGVPLWSAGLGWNLHNEKFYHLDWLPYLKLRLTYGYNGNVDNSTSAYLTASQIGSNLWLNPFNQIVNPPNPSLRWERVQNTNIGLDFGTKNNRISGSLEYYIKNGQDLMGYGPVAPQTGVSQFYGNVANTNTKGVDIKISTVNIASGNFGWESVVILNLNEDKVTDYKVNPGINEDVVGSGGIVPIEGKPIFGMVSYIYGGLDAEGNPMGYLDGKLSVDYTSMINSLDRNNLDFHGSIVPTVLGSLRNTIRFKSFELSFNILLKAGYYFRKRSFQSNNLIGAGTWLGIADYQDRWQNPGDEAYTQVPKFLYPFNTNRDLFYGLSSYLIEDGSHIRLQDIQFNYQFQNGFKKGGKKIFSDLNLYIYVSNLGILWRANKSGLDPDVPYGSPVPLSVSTGIRASF